MRVLVTGGAGFIGTHLTRHLLNLQHQVLVLDNLFAGKREHLHRGAEFREIDLATASWEGLSVIFDAFQPTHVVHLAALHYIPYCMQHPDETFASNVRGTEILLRVIERSRVIKLVAASTVDVYPTIDRVHREDDALGPCNVYGLSKLLMEHLVEYGTRTNSSLSAVSLRFSNVYGPKETNPHFIPRVLEFIQSREVSEFRMGYLGGTRDFVHVADVARAVTACLFNPTGKYDVFNVSTGIPTTVREVMEVMKAKASDNRLVIEDKALFRAFDRVSLTADTKKIEDRLGWRAEVRLERGLSELVAQTAAAFA